MLDPSVMLIISASLDNSCPSFWMRFNSGDALYVLEVLGLLRYLRSPLILNRFSLESQNQEVQGELFFKEEACK